MQSGPCRGRHVPGPGSHELVMRVHQVLREGSFKQNTTLVLLTMTAPGKSRHKFCFLLKLLLFAVKNRELYD